MSRTIIINEFRRMMKYLKSAYLEIDSTLWMEGKGRKIWTAGIPDVNEVAYYKQKIEQEKRIQLMIKEIYYLVRNLKKKTNEVWER